MSAESLLIIPREDIDATQTPLEPVMADIYEQFGCEAYNGGDMPGEVQIAIGELIVAGREKFLRVYGSNMPPKRGFFGGLQRERQIANAVYQGLKAIDFLKHSSDNNGQVELILDGSRALISAFNQKSCTQVTLEDFIPYKEALYTGIEAERLLVSQFTRQMYKLVKEKRNFVYSRPPDAARQIATDMSTFALFGLQNAARNYNPYAKTKDQEDKVDEGEEIVFEEESNQKGKLFQPYCCQHIKGMIQKVVTNTVKRPELKYNQFEHMGKLLKVLDELVQNGFDVDVISDELIAAIHQRLNGGIKYPVRHNATPEDYIEWLLDVRKAINEGVKIPLYDERVSPRVTQEGIETTYNDIEDHYEAFVNNHAAPEVNWHELMEAIVYGRIHFDKQNSQHIFARKLAVLKMRLGLLYVYIDPDGNVVKEKDFSDAVGDYIEKTKGGRKDRRDRKDLMPTMTLEEIGEIFGITKEMVRGILRNIAAVYGEFIRDEVEAESESIEP